MGEEAIGRYDEASGAYTTVTLSPWSPLVFPTAVALDARSLLLFGGVAREQWERYVEEVQRYVDDQARSGGDVAAPLQVHFETADAAAIVDTETGEVEMLAPLPRPMYLGLAVALPDGRVLVGPGAPGGFASSDAASLNPWLIFDPADRAFRAIEGPPDLVIAVQQTAGAVVLPDGSVLVVGQRAESAQDAVDPLARETLVYRYRP